MRSLHRALDRCAADGIVADWERQVIRRAMTQVR